MTNGCFRYFYSGMQKIIEYRYKFNHNLNEIFMFHKIVEDDSYRQASNMVISFSDFKLFIEILKNTGQICRIDEINNISTYLKKYYLTFDDGYAETYKTALRWLSKNKIPFTVFVTTSFLDKTEYLSINQLKCLSKNNYCTIGAHTVTHPLLRNLNKEEVRTEIFESKKELERITEKEVNYFAYPYGSNYACSKLAIKVAKSCGFINSFSTYNMGLSSSYMKRNPYFLPRINVDKAKIQMYEVMYERRSQG